jgi:hypothetical protein
MKTSIQLNLLYLQGYDVFQREVACLFTRIHAFLTPTLHPLHPPPPYLSLSLSQWPSITGYNHPAVKEALASNSLSTLVNRPALLVLPPMDFAQRIKNTLLTVS